MKLYIPIVGYFYEGGTVLGVFDTNQKAQNRLDEYIKGYDTACIGEIDLNSNEEIDI